MPASVQNEPSNLKYLMWQGNQDFVSSVHYGHIRNFFFFFATACSELHHLEAFCSSFSKDHHHSGWKHAAQRPRSLWFQFFSIGLLWYERQCQPQHNGISCLRSSFYCNSQVPITESLCTSVRVNQIRTLNQAYPGPPVREEYQRVPACRPLLSSPHNNGMQRSEMLWNGEPLSRHVFICRPEYKLKPIIMHSPWGVLLDSLFNYIFNRFPGK